MRRRRPDLCRQSTCPTRSIAVTEQEITAFRVRYKRRWEFEHHYHQPLAIMTQRSRLDAFMAEQAASQGADFRDASPVRSIEGTTITLANGDQHQAAAIIAADGANGVVRRALGLPQTPRRRRARGQRRTHKRSPPANAGPTPSVSNSAPCPAATAGSSPKPTTATSDSEAAPPPRQPSVANSPIMPTANPSRPTISHNSEATTSLSADPTAPSSQTESPSSETPPASSTRSPEKESATPSAVDNSPPTPHSKSSADTKPTSPPTNKQSSKEIEPELRVARQLQALFHYTPWPYVQLLKRSNRFWQAFCRIVRGESTYKTFQDRLGPAKKVSSPIAAAAMAESRNRSSGWERD